MKKYFLFLMFSILLAPAARPWRLYDVLNAGDETQFLLYHIAGTYKETGEGKVIYCVSTPKGGDKNTFSRDAAGAMNAWIQNTITHINKSGRQAEFGDIIKVLSGVQFYEADCADADVEFVFNGPASYTRLNPLRVYLNKDNYKWQPVLHEAGHAFRTADLYEGSKNAAPRYGTDDGLESIMMDPSHKDLTCDDAEAVINIYDCFSRKEPFYRGGDKGWKSICPGRDITYKKCMAE